MLAFFAVRGVNPEIIVKASPLVQRFYYHAMEMYYKEKEELIKLTGGRF